MADLLSSLNGLDILLNTWDFFTQLQKKKKKILHIEIRTQLLNFNGKLISPNIHFKILFFFVL